MVIALVSIATTQKPLILSSTAAVGGRRRRLSIENSVSDKGSRRRALCSSLLLASTIAIPEASDSQKALIQKYLKKTEENKAKNDKERLDNYYKRNYKDYFGLVEGGLKGKEGELSESEKEILKWLETNK